MILNEDTPVDPAALPVAAFRSHLRLGTGFGEDSLQDAVLVPCLRAALAAIEARTGKAVLRRRFLWRVEAWRDAARQMLPVAPVPALVSVSLRMRDGSVKEVPPERYRLAEDAHRPALAATGARLPLIPTGGAAEVLFEAGYGAGWETVPGDLAQAVLMLAAHHYARRGDGEGEVRPMPGPVEGLLGPYRPVRLLGGAA
ncbi:phage conserved hypothetical protein, phiE125 gp8 family [Tranquillimonas rosea]|uniref:Phage gp6-like head-tail connector protein n=1 Tax=Tranquillimonas rosea TaxID=641238 RepID=A0A1H9TEC1_9RHOB|nr:hypothetical protein [Tranquillimonas rosea]SER95179.1 phage conserved hypothetical protein, phiE125 gp8 family [Tranquillimonas rosea]